jgi:ankyrin repeat protein
LASKNGHFEVVRCLVVGGCDLHAVNQAGQTAEDIAMKDGHTEIGNLLIRVKQVHDVSLIDL